MGNIYVCVHSTHYLKDGNLNIKRHGIDRLYLTKEKNPKKTKQ